ncbi:transcriptional regulator with PAS, ATPase and Fis domain [Natronocella acetinitrilica]|uniref:Transcriptional regulator with PAS, ATPase and Fis domain n=1 Tax=Natronocella acetinitrilica TaxID=414046 RepID=A0AAE3G1T7_9GAMM|nr:sigma 54-interacting transcriptional regulator [Natronocella acetinitrilica]MCP1673832.1 transcriptional regulator with PAS, ATPase and Fis domain [Natronocella acetinitrilica]
MSEQAERRMSIERPFPGGDDNGLTMEVVSALFPIFEQASAGAIAVDDQARITWINGSYCELLGVKDPATVIGKHVTEVIPPSRMPEVVRNGQPILLDIMEYRNQQLVVMRLPVFDTEERVIGAVAFVLYDDVQPLTPLVSKFRRLQQDLAAARRALARRHARYELSDFVGASPQALEAKRRARLAAARNTPVLLLGETGTGKEVLAQAIHAASDRSEQPFIAVNVAAVPESLLEAEFFGVAQGAYTGANLARDGKFQLADGGTLFLDEVGDMPLPLQAKLLRVLQEGEVEPLGSNRVRQVDVRVMAATSRDLDHMVASGEFRSDLYYRLNVLQIRLPPLRERLVDLGVLCEAILEDISRRGERRTEITEAAISLLAGHHWPGNVRELRNLLEQALTLSEQGELLDADHLRALLPSETAPRRLLGGATLPVRPLQDVVQDAEREAIRAALTHANGNKARAARLLGIARSVLYEKLEKLS